MAREARLGREILRLAVPAFGALIAEPLFLLADSAIIGHLGVAELAGAGLATTVLHTAVGLMVFLAYSTTPAVARLVGAGHPEKALAAGRDGLWLAGVLGVILALLGLWTARPLLATLGASDEAVLGFAAEYLLWSLPGLVAMLLVFAGTGVLRGFQDTRTPLVVAGAGFGINIVLNWILVYGMGLSVAGSALGTSIAQWLMALVYIVMVARRAAGLGVRMAPDLRGVLSLAQVGSWLMLRTASMRLAILATVFVAGAQGPVNLAAHQLTMTIFSFLAFALDALAIAAQAMIGKELGAHDLAKVRELTRTMMRWGLGFGVITGVFLAAVSPWAGWLFTPDERVHQSLLAALLVLAVGQPIAGLVFVLDGVLIGAGDARYLALAGVVNVLVYAPLLLGVYFLGPREGSWALFWLWLAFGIGYMSARALTLGWRVRKDEWMVAGA